MSGNQRSTAEVDSGLDPEAEGPDSGRTFRSSAEVLGWDDYFMSVAYLSAMRSKDSNNQVGACIVNELNRIVGTGYNGMPDKNKSGQAQNNNDSDAVWKRSVKRYFVCHAELNAILNSFGGSLEKSRIYVTRTPCNECAKLIVQSGIKEIICHSTKPFNTGYDRSGVAGRAALEMLERASVVIRIFQLNLHKILSSFQKSYEDNENNCNPEAEIE